MCGLAVESLFMSTHKQPAAPPRSMLSMLQRKDLAGFWWTVGLLYLAEAVFSLAVIWGTYRYTHSPEWVSVAVILQLLPMIGVGVWGPGPSSAARPIVLWAGLTMLLPMPILLAGPSVDVKVAVLLAEALGQALLSARLIPLLQALLMERAAEGRPQAASGFELISRSSRLVGPALGGWLWNGHGLMPILGFAGLVLLAAAALLPSVRAEHKHTESKRELPGIGGLRIVRGDRFLLSALSTRAIANFVWPAFTLGLPILVATRWHGGASTYGLVLSVFGLSNLAGTSISSRLRHRHLQVGYFAAWILTGVGFLALSMTTAWGLALVVAMVGGIGGPLVHVALDAHIGEVVTAQARSQVFAVQRLIMSVLGFLGTAVVGVALATMGAVTVLAIAGTVTVLGAAGGLWWDLVRYRREAGAGSGAATL